MAWFGLVLVCSALALGLEIPAALHKVKYVTDIIPPPSLSPAQRAAALVSQMNLTEKIDMLHGWEGDYVGNVIGNSRLGIPALNLNDGPQVAVGIFCFSFFPIAVVLLPSEFIQRRRY
jgi:hypothetical protein